MPKTSNQGGYTIIEILITISIIVVLARLILPSLSDGVEKANYARATQEFRSIYQSLQQYKSEYGEYPPDANRDIPPGLEEFLAPGIWPSAPWRGSVYDYDRFDDPDNPGEEVFQISARFCDIGDPSSCRFPDEPWAENFDVNSSVYYCIQGACRAHPNRPLSHPGHCVNCP